MKWNKTIGWIAVGIGGVLIAVLVTAFFVLRSAGFHRYAIAKIVQAVDEATGGRAEVRSVDFHWGTLTADLNGVIVHGTEPAGAPPLLQVDRLSASLKIISVLHRQVNLSDLVIEHSVIHLAVARDGTTNIPHPAPSTSDGGSSTNVFDLAVGHALLERGVVYYNDKENALNADVQDLHTEINFTYLLTRYAGSVNYQDGHIQYANLAPLAHSLELQFTAQPKGLTVSPLVLKVGSSRISLNANLDDYANPKVEGDYGILIHTQDFAGMLKDGRAAGDISSAGKLHYQSMPNVTILQAVAADGQIESHGLTLDSSQGHVAISSLQGRYQLTNGNLQVRNFLANLFRGRVQAEGEIKHLDAIPAISLRTSLHGISIDAMRSAVRMEYVRNMPLTGKIDGTADASWAGSIDKIRVRSDLAVNGAILNASAGNSVPLKAAIHADYDGASETLNVRQSTLQTPASSLVAQGQMSQHSSLTIQMRTSDLHELALLAPANANGSAVNIAGAANLNATVRGSTSNPQISAQISAQNLQVNGSQPSNVRLTAQASPSEISIQNGTLTGLGQGQVQFDAKAALRHWSYEPSNALAAHVIIRQVPVDQLAKLGKSQSPVTGVLSADVALQGSQLNPVGHGTLQLTNAKAFGENIQSVSAQFEGAGGTVRSTLKVNAEAGALTAQANFVPRTRAYEIHLDAPAIQLDQIQALAAQGFPVTGTAKITASGSGTLDKPQLTATVEVPELQVQQTTITGIKADLSVADQHAKLAVVSTIIQANIQAHAEINLSGGYYTEATIDSSRLPLDALLATYVANRPAGIKGETEFHATLKGPLKDKSQIEAHVTIPVLNAEYRSLKIASVGAIKADYAQSVLTLQPAELKGTGTSLRFEGRIPLQGDAPMSLTAQGSIDMQLLEIFSSDVQSSGQLALDIRSTGTTRQPEVKGQLKLQDVAFVSTASPLGLEHMNGTLDIGNERIRVSQLTAQLGGGQLTAGGFITYRPAVQFNLALETKSVRLRYPDGVRTVFDSNLAFVGNPQQAELNGRVLIEGLSFTSDFDLSTLMSQFTGNSAPPMGESFADNVRLNINVQSAEDLNAASAQLSIEGQVNLRAIGTLSDPVLVGRTDLTAGDIFLFKQRYQLERGVINFTSPTRTHPIVNISMTTTINQYNLTLNVTGPIEKLTTSYSSDPPLPPVDIINLIARGSTTEASGPSNLGADTVLAQGVASQVSSSVGKLAGISSLQIDPLLGGNNRNPSARVAIQKRVTKNFIFTFSTDVTDPQSEIIQGEYQINRRWSVSVARDEGGGVSVDGRFHTTF